MREPRLLDLMPNLVSDGSFFKYLPTYGNSTPLNLGISYALHHSGEKYPTRLVKRYIDEETGIITQSGEEAIGQLLRLVFSDNWNRIFDALMLEYNPIENYAMTEEGKDIRTGSDTLTKEMGEQTLAKNYGEKIDNEVISPFSHTETLGNQEIVNDYGEKQRNENLGGVTNTDTYGNRKTNTINSKNAFNEGIVTDTQTEETSDAYTDTKEETARVNDFTEKAYQDVEIIKERINKTEESEKNTKRTMSGYKDEEVIGGKTDTDTTKYDNTLTHTLKRSGNIGVTTSQQMLQSELDIRTYNFFENMFSDIDKYLTLSVY